MNETGNAVTRQLWTEDVDSIVHNLGRMEDAMMVAQRRLADIVSTIYRTSRIDDGLAGDVRRLVSIVLDNRIALTERIERFAASCRYVEAEVRALRREVLQMDMPMRQEGARRDTRERLLARCSRLLSRMNLTVDVRHRQIEHIDMEMELYGAPDLSRDAADTPEKWCDMVDFADRVFSREATLSGAGDARILLIRHDHLFHLRCAVFRNLVRLGRIGDACSALSDVESAGADLFNLLERLVPQPDS